VRCIALESAGRGFAEPFGRSAIGFHFRHCCKNSNWVRSGFFLFRRKRHAKLLAFQFRELLHDGMFG
jgi:hypothetical protein